MAFLAIRSVWLPLGEASVIVPAPSWLGLALHSACRRQRTGVAERELRGLTPGTSCCPVPVNTEIWLFGPGQHVTFIIWESWVMAWSRWSSSVAAELSGGAAPKLLVDLGDLLQLIVGRLHAVGDALLGLRAQLLDVAVIELRFCVSACAAPTTRLAPNTNPDCSKAIAARW